MARRVKLGSQVPYGKWIPVTAVKFGRGGSTQIKTTGPAKRKRRRNVAAGHYFEDDSGRYRFHPIRASFDYDPSRLSKSSAEYKRWKKGTGKRKKSRAKTKRRKR